MNDHLVVPGKRLGRLPTKTSTKTLHLSNFLKAGPDVPQPPIASNFWQRRRPFSHDTYGNDKYGDCTIASQAHLARRMERLEQGKTIEFTEEEVIRRYLDMTQRLYGGGDTGANEEDALGEWRKPDLTFKDTRGHPQTIDAFMKVDVKNPDEIRKAIWLAGAHGMKLCFDLPTMWSKNVKVVWDVRRNRDGTIDLTGDAAVGSWGGHSMMTDDYDEIGLSLPSTWGDPDYMVSWDAVVNYGGEAHICIDSIDAWLHQGKDKIIDLAAVKDAVNQVSSQKLR